MITTINMRPSLSPQINLNINYDSICRTSDKYFLSVVLIDSFHLILIPLSLRLIDYGYLDPVCALHHLHPARLVLVYKYHVRNLRRPSIWDSGVWTTPFANSTLGQFRRAHYQKSSAHTWGGDSKTGIPGTCRRAPPRTPNQVRFPRFGGNWKIRK